MRYLLSIHDVWPGNFPQVEEHWRRLQSLGMGPAALLVVPEYHGRRPIGAERDFLAWLSEKRAQGSEVLLHGFRHRAAELCGAALSRRRGPVGRWINRSLTGGEAEFSGLARADREGLLLAGSEAFRGAGLPLHGFVAPTWHGAPPKASLAAAGFRILETRSRLHDLARGTRRLAPALAWSQARGEAALFGGRAWLRLALRLPLIKVAIHPGDLRGGGVIAMLEEVAAAGRPCAYGQAFNGA